MVQFITRVELHGAHSEQDYGRLHSAMEAAGFVRTIQGQDGLHYKLPTAMYVSYGDSTAASVLDSARRAAIQSGYNHWVLTSRADDIAWLTPLASVPASSPGVVPNALSNLGGGLFASNPLTPPTDNPFTTLLGAARSPKR